MTFRIGQKVVCIDVDDLPHRQPSRPVAASLTLGAIYTIRWVGEAPFEVDRIVGPTVRLHEVIRPPNSTGRWPDYPFAASRFRPVIERKTDISFAHEILRKASKPARGPAISSPTRVCP